MTIETIKQQIDVLQSDDRASFTELANLAAMMREAAGDMLTDSALTFQFDECAARIECFLAMAQPGIQRIEEAIGSIVTTMRVVEAVGIHEEPGAMQ